MSDVIDQRLQRWHEREFWRRVAVAVRSRDPDKSGVALAQAQLHLAALELKP